MGPNFRSKACWLCALAFNVLLVQSITLDVDDATSIRSAAATVAYGLQSLYKGNETGGTVGKFPYLPYYWWESGAAWGAMINYWHYTGDDSYNNVTYNALVAQISSTDDFMPLAETFDEGNDDQAFWIFAALSAAEYGFPEPPSPYPSWLTISENAFNDYVSRWDTATCNGGLKWQIYSQNSGYDYKNSISNGGFFQVAARLARLTGNQTFVDWANEVWDWTTAIGLMDSQYAVYDGTADTSNCSSIDHLQWTYNVGIYLYGAAVMLNYTNGTDEWVQRTDGLLTAAGLFMSPYSNATGILYEIECEEGLICDTDQISMKGYLARWLAGTSTMAPSTAGQVGQILRASAAGAAAACSGGTDGTTCGQKWYTNGWDGTSGMGQELAALEVLYTLLVNSTSPPSSFVSTATTSTSSSSSVATSTTSKSASSSTLSSSISTSSSASAIAAVSQSASQSSDSTHSNSTSSTSSAISSSNMTTSPLYGNTTTADSTTVVAQQTTPPSSPVSTNITSVTSAPTIGSPYTSAGTAMFRTNVFYCSIAFLLASFL